jgi:magnesium-transporting ATPase (P-type)
MPRSSIVKNSNNIYAMVVYTGMETKLSLNEGKYLNKLSNLSYQLNIFLGINILVMSIMAILMS